MNNDETIIAALKNLLKPSLKGNKKGSRRSSKQKNNQYKTYKNVQFVKFGVIFAIILLVIILITVVNNELKTKSDSEIEPWISFKNLLIVILVVCVIIIVLSYFERFRPWLESAIKTLAVVSLFYVATSFFELNYKSNLNSTNKVFNVLTIAILVLFTVVTMQIIFTKPSNEIYNLITSSFNIY